MKPWKKSLAAVVLLLLLPLTLAPRTSWTLDSVEYDLATAIAQTSVRTGAGVPVKFELASRSDEVIEQAYLIIDLTVDGVKETAKVLSAPRGCTVTGGHAECLVGPIAARGSAVVTLVAAGSTKGTLLVAVTEGFSGEQFGTAQIPVVTAPRSSGRRR